MVKRVQVYYNIRRGDYSVRQSGRVIDHVDSIVLRDVRFNVAAAGRDKVRATGVKNVHATVTGYILTNNAEHFEKVYSNAGNDHDFVAYNPFKYNQFVKLLQCDMYTPVHSADYVALLPNREIRTWGVK